MNRFVQYIKVPLLIYMILIGGPCWSEEPKIECPPEYQSVLDRLEREYGYTPPDTSSIDPEENNLEGYDFDWFSKNDMRAAYRMCATQGFKGGDCPKVLVRCWRRPMIYRRHGRWKSYCTGTPDFSEIGYKAAENILGDIRDQNESGKKPAGLQKMENSYRTQFEEAKNAIEERRSQIRSKEKTRIALEEEISRYESIPFRSGRKEKGNRGKEK